MINNNKLKSKILAIYNKCSLERDTIAATGRYYKILFCYHYNIALQRNCWFQVSQYKSHLCVK